MKLFLIPALASLFAGAAAQSIAIGYPADQSSISPGQSLTVQVNRPNSLTGSQEVAIAISLASCASATCNPSQRLGTVLYTGPFNPQYPTHRTPQNVPQQNFTVTVPSGFGPGPASLSVTHLTLVGAGPFPLFEIKNVTLNCT